MKPDDIQGMPTVTPINPAVIIAACIIAVATILGVVIVSVRVPDSGTTVAAILAGGAGSVSALLGLLMNRNVQVVSQRLDGRLTQLISEVEKRAAAQGAAAAKEEAAEVARAVAQETIATIAGNGPPAPPDSNPIRKDEP